MFNISNYQMAKQTAKVQKGAKQNLNTRNSNLNTIPEDPRETMFNLEGVIENPEILLQIDQDSLNSSLIIENDQNSDLDSSSNQTINSLSTDDEISNISSSSKRSKKQKKTLEQLKTEYKQNIAQKHMNFKQKQQERVMALILKSQKQKQYSEQN